jgi:thiamine pyrophosphate-dependent acetolactate synthase large subunit-like protein
MPEVADAAPPAMVEKAVALMRTAKRPVILAGRVSRSEAAWTARVALAERLGAQVVTDLKAGAAFPTNHPLHAGAPSTIMPVPEAIEALRAADLIISLDWIDLAGTLSKHVGEHNAQIIQVTIDHQLHNGWSLDYQGLPPVDVLIACEPDTAVPPLLAALGPSKPPSAAPSKPAVDFKPAGDKLNVDHLAVGLRKALSGREVTLAHLPLSWDGRAWSFQHPLDYLGGDGGGGIGGGPGISVGAALALKDAARMAGFADVPDAAVRAVRAPTLIIAGDRDVASFRDRLEDRNPS